MSISGHPERPAPLICIPPYEGPPSPARATRRTKLAHFIYIYPPTYLHSNTFRTAHFRRFQRTGRGPPTSSTCPASSAYCSFFGLAILSPRGPPGEARPHRMLASGSGSGVCTGLLPRAEEMRADRLPACGGGLGLQLDPAGWEKLKTVRLNRGHRADKSLCKGKLDLSVLEKPKALPMFFCHLWQRW